MGKSAPPVGDRPTAVMNEFITHNKVLWRAQARSAALMVEFSGARKESDERVIADRVAEGSDARFAAGEFAAIELSLAGRMSKHLVRRTAAMAHRLRTECPDAWDAWEHGDIDQDKAIRINRALRRLVHDRSKLALNNLVVDVAICKTPELLGRWLNQFIASAEPDETDERLRRSLDDRYVSIRPDIDGISFLHAALSAVDATAVEQILNALAAIAEPDDPRTKQQRRADALVDLVCGRIGNGCHGFDETDPGFDTNSDTDDHLDDDEDPAVGNGSDDDHHADVDGSDATRKRENPADPRDSDRTGSGNCDGDPANAN